MKPIHFLAGAKVTRTSLIIYTLIVFGFALMMTWYFPMMDDMINDPMAEAEGIKLTEMGANNYNLTWDARVGASYHVAMGSSDPVIAGIFDEDIEVPSHLAAMIPNASEMAVMITNETLLNGYGVHLYYKGHGTFIDFQRIENDSFFWAVFLNSEKNKTIVNVSQPVSTTDLLVTSQFDEYLEDNKMMEAMFGTSELDFTSFEGYISLEFFSFWPLLFVIFLSIKAGGMISRHVEDRSMDILLATGYSRNRFMAEGLMLQGLNMVMVLLGGFLGLVLGCVLISEPIIWKSFFMGFLGSLPMTFAFVGIAVVISVLIDEGAKCTGAVMGVVMGSYVLQIISNLAPDTTGDVLGYLCLFKYYEAYDLVFHQSIGLVDVVVPVAVGMVAFAAAYILFKRKEIHA